MMNGTEKQIKWAQDIIAVASMQFDEVREEAEEELKKMMGKSSRPELIARYEKALEAASRYESRLREIDEADEIIEIRDTLFINKGSADSRAVQIQRAIRVLQAMAGFPRLRMVMDALAVRYLAPRG